MTLTHAPHVLIDEQPGHAIRRLHQIAVGIFLHESQACGITPVQYAALQCIANQPGVDQRTLASGIAQDTSTTAGVVERLETRGLITRSVSAQDRRVRLLEITDAGIGLLQTLVPHMLQAQERLLAPLSADERHTFMTLLQRLVTANNDHSRAPANTLPPKTAENRANA
ncbi:MAG: hypothetical protein RL323_2217 [Pseudomonadota bacterium]|jgi:MarR family transcriptional regulator, lower aerobic nicotinate degradation pathway regulator